MSLKTETPRSIPRSRERQKSNRIDEHRDSPSSSLSWTRARGLKSHVCPSLRVTLVCENYNAYFKNALYTCIHVPHGPATRDSLHHDKLITLFLRLRLAKTSTRKPTNITCATFKAPGEIIWNDQQAEKLNHTARSIAVLESGVVSNHCIFSLNATLDLRRERP